VNIAVFDLETNGLTGSSVLSASSIVFGGEGAILGLFNRFYLPAERPDRRAERIHGLTPGRILALREHIPAPSYFIEDWPELLRFWADWKVAGVAAHNLSFDISFLPGAAQGAFQWWCSMRGLTAYCALPKRPGGGRSGAAAKWPRLEEAAAIVCGGPNSLPPPEETERAERVVGERVAHVSLFDCFELYRVVSRVAKHRMDLLRFAPFSAPFKFPHKKWNPPETFFPSSRDSFTKSVLDCERRIRAAVR
jgi:hypothetical protein